MFDPPSLNPYSSLNSSVLNNAHGQGLALSAGCIDACTVLYHAYAHGEALALSAGHQSIVLLQNNASQIQLPLSSSQLKGKKVALIGPQIDDTATIMERGDYDPQQIITIQQGMQTEASTAGFTLTVDTGKKLKTAKRSAASADVVVAVVGGNFGHEAHDRTRLDEWVTQSSQLMEVTHVQCMDGGDTCTVHVLG